VLKATVQQPPREAGIELANWNWKAVREFIKRRFDQERCRSSCLNYRHRLGFILRRPKKRLTKADAAKREEFVRRSAEVRQEAERTGTSIWFVDEAFFRADADLRGIWVLKGKPARVASSSPSLKEKVVYSSAACLATGAVEMMEVEGTGTAETSVAFLRQLRANHPEALIVIWDNGPAHRGDALRTYLATPDLRLVPLPGYSPDYNADEAIWDWVREDVTANTCLGTKAKVREHVSAFLQGLSARRDEVKQRCRTVLQAQAEAIGKAIAPMLQTPDHVDPTLALV
jgi:transposase